MIEKGEKVFQDLVKQFPQSAWAYIAWGDMYWFYKEQKQIPLDYVKAETIYRLALKNNVDEPKEVQSRLRMLAKEMGGKGFGTPQFPKKKQKK